MKTTQIAQYALKLSYAQAQPRTSDKMMARSAYALAAIGLGLSTFSVRKMVISGTRRF